MGLAIEDTATGFSWENQGRGKGQKKVGKAPLKIIGKYKKKEGGKKQEWGPEIMQKLRKSLPNRKQQRRLRRRPKGAALRAAPLGFVVFDLVRISYVLA